MLQTKIVVYVLLLMLAEFKTIIKQTQDIVRLAMWMLAFYLQKVYLQIVLLQYSSYFG